MLQMLERTFEIGALPDYEPDPATSIAARARAESRSPLALALDLLVADRGRALLYHPFENYNGGSLDEVREMLLDPDTVLGLGDAGAHVAMICDASSPTSLLTHWGRDRVRGEGIPLERLVASRPRRRRASSGSRTAVSWPRASRPT